MNVKTFCENTHATPVDMTTGLARGGRVWPPTPVDIIACYKLKVDTLSRLELVLDAAWYCAAGAHKVDS